MPLSRSCSDALATDGDCRGEVTLEMVAAALDRPSPPMNGGRSGVVACGAEEPSGSSVLGRPISIGCVSDDMLTRLSSNSVAAGEGGMQESTRAIGLVGFMARDEVEELARDRGFPIGLSGANFDRHRDDRVEIWELIRETPLREPPSEPLDRTEVCKSIPASERS